MHKDVSHKWKSELVSGGYDHKFIDCSNASKLSRVWKRILSHTYGANANRLKILDIGCGGAKNIAMLALNGNDCVGMDVSPEVTERAWRYINDVESNCGPIGAEVFVGDIFEFEITDMHASMFDIVFHFGVIEHFLEENDRLVFLDKMYRMVKPGGYVVSVVPSGMHPIRKKQRDLGLGGYVIPEIDYTDQIMRSEFEIVGLKDIKVLPHNIFNYLYFEKYSKSYRFKKLLAGAAQIIPVSLFRSSFAFKHCGSLVGIGKK